MQVVEASVMVRKFKLKILPSNKTIEVNENETVLEALLKNGVYIENVCGGKGICGKCAVKVLNGTLSGPTMREKQWQSILGSNVRLSCQAKLLSDSEIELAETSIKAKIKILTWSKNTNFIFSPSIKKRAIKLRKPTLEDNTADLERILEAINMKQFDPKLLESLSDLLWKSDFHVDAILFEDELIDLLPHSDESHIYGIAFDIGTTTVVGYLYDLIDGKMVSVKSLYNSQIKYGEDVISRIERASKSREAAMSLQKEILNTINEIIHDTTKDTSVDPLKIYEIVCSGNSVMTSFLLGSSCFYASKAPYVPPFTSSIKTKIRDLHLSANPSGYLKTLPLVSAYIGGDVVADILISELHKFKEPVALIDLGTNGEVVINSGNELIAASCAAGPALEGYGVKNGMRAVEGAIESVVISEDKSEVYYRTIGNSKPVGICGSGIVEALAWMKIRGIVDNTGKVIEGTSKRVIRENGELQFILVDETKSRSGKRIVISQGDIRKIQLAKAAVFSTFLTLLRIIGLTHKDVKKLFVAGAFGNYIDSFYAKIIGLLPDLPKERIVQIGNGSGAGASALLLSKDLWDEANFIVKRIKVIELNLIQSFKGEFVNATFIPHKDESLFEDVLSSISSLVK